jgi:hypothetical protein
MEFLNTGRQFPTRFSRNLQITATEKILVKMSLFKKEFIYTFFKSGQFTSSDI